MAKDGEYGRLQQLILDPHKDRVVALVVRQFGLYGPLNSRTVIVPEEEVADATDKEVRLKISREQVNALPEYKLDSVLLVEGRNYEVDDEFFTVRGPQGFEFGRIPTEQQPGFLEDEIGQSERKRLALQLRGGHKVFCRDGHAGTVSMMLLDPRGRVKGFVMHAGHLPGRNLIVPVAWVQEVDIENVHLSVEKSALESLPDYSPDFELASEVDKALWADDIVRRTDYTEINVTVENGIVILRGHVVTSMNRSRAENAARSIHGVLGVENHLAIDGDLVIEVAQALGSDKCTQLEKVSVGAQNGVILLNGQVTSAAVREAAEEVAAGVPQVRGVANYLKAPNVVVDPAEQQVWEPPIGQEVYATDMLLGRVERVVINPHNRRVTAFVAHDNFSDLQNTADDELPDESRRPENRVLVPIRAVRYETDSSVLLNVTGSEAVRGHDFKPNDFVSPPENWLPPYPYYSNDVLFEKATE
ncbi:MAG: BON domain-containing protein [Anaerolineaceae bacterium]|nr:BON domain-containing protein [Anaerolineaceae bacterium]